ncbi:ABC transporter substrate-binding protein [Flexibacterium corallicola]|uniref:ABC transporter substrate-binding protein n=1 Tax=Flexibacterium corallicola TaxID=3037259 RepID=UPI00286F28B6|nr:ABC transporter substrate-binding protein [Pseudovibrio sp. M1P-2-3]
MKETPGLSKLLPPISQRAPDPPFVTNMESIGRTTGSHGGTLHTLIGRSKDVRLINVWGYARLVGYDEDLRLRADILESYETEEDRVITLHLRANHKWSNGSLFTSEDFRFWFEDIAGNDDLSPTGYPAFMLVEGKAPILEILSPTSLRFTWSAPNPLFLPELAAARPPFIYRPSQYLKQFHIKYGNHLRINELLDDYKVRSWAALFNRLDDSYNARNPHQPTLQPWVRTELGSERRFVLHRNPYFHRFDSTGQQLPYIDRVVMSVTDNKLIAAKTQAGDSNLQARGLSFTDISVLKRGEEFEGYTTNLWLGSKGSQISILPNLAVKNPVWKKVLRDDRFRRALSLGIDRKLINKVLYFGLAEPGNDTVLSLSPLYRPIYQYLGAEYDPESANALLDDMGLTKRRSDGTRLLPDGRPLDIIVEVSGESQEEEDAMELVRSMWHEIGVSIYVKPSQRDTMRSRALAGTMIMSVWSGFENGVPTANMPPTDYAPTRSDFLSWAPWGNYYETEGQAGEKPDWPPAERLLTLYEQWLESGLEAERRKIWVEMLMIHAREKIHIGLVSQVLQPVVVKDVKNVPKEALYGWDPGAQFGIYRMDAFYFDGPKHPSAGLHKTHRGAR